MEPVFERLTLASIVVDKGFNCRQTMDETELNLLGESLVADGQDDPITVNWCEADERYHLIDGERRYRALTRAGIETAECKVYRDLDALAALKKHLRSDVYKTKLSPMDQAIGMQRLVELGEPIKAIAAFFGCGDDMVRRRLDLLDLPAEVQKMVTRKLYPLPIRHAEYLTHLNDSDALRIARQAAPSTGPVVAEEQVKAWVDQLTKGPELPGMNHRPPSRQQRREQKKKQVQRQASPPPAPQESPAPTSGHSGPSIGIGDPGPMSRAAGHQAEDLQAVECAVGIVGKLAVDSHGALVIQSPMISFKVGADGIHMVKRSTCDLPVSDTKDFIALHKLLRAHQPKPAPEKPKKAAKKKK